MNAVLFYFFGAFPLGDYMRSSVEGTSLGNATRTGYTRLVNGISQITTRRQSPG